MGKLEPCMNCLFYHVISLCSLTPQPCNERLIFTHYWRLIQGIMISNSFAKAEIWCEISILIIFRIIFQLNYFTYWSKRSHYCFSCGTKHLVQSSWIPAAVSLGQNFTPGYLLSLNPLLSWSCSLWLPSSYFFFYLNIPWADAEKALLSDKGTLQPEWFYLFCLCLIHRCATRITKQLMFHAWSLSSSEIFSYFRECSGFSVFLVQ